MGEYQGWVLREGLYFGECPRWRIDPPWRVIRRRNCPADIKPKCIQHKARPNNAVSHSRLHHHRFL